MNKTHRTENAFQTRRCRYNANQCLSQFTHFFLNIGDKRYISPIISLPPPMNAMKIPLNSLNSIKKKHQKKHCKKTCVLNSV